MAHVMLCVCVAAEWEAWHVCDFAHCAKLRRNVLIQQRNNRKDAGNMHAVMFLQRQGATVELLSVRHVKPV